MGLDQCNSCRFSALLKCGEKKLNNGYAPLYYGFNDYCYNVGLANL